MPNRREFLKTAAFAALAGGCRTRSIFETRGVYANDIHSELNSTRMREIVRVTNQGELSSLIRKARRSGSKISLAGSRHAMGGQQFGTDTINLDMRGLTTIGELDRARGIIEVGSGVEWPELVQSLVSSQKGESEAWGIAQKQTGADRLTIGGALSANVHGRGLRMKPFVQDIESFRMVTADAETLDCSRTENRELFQIAVGGYGLFGAVESVRLRLMRRVAIERIVEIRSVRGLMSAMQQRIDEGHIYGDFQFSIDEGAEGFMRDGVFSCYRPVDRVPPDSQQELSDESWSQLMQLAHFDKRKAYELYTGYYMSTNGQRYWSDTHQLSVYLNDYHDRINTDARRQGSEIITEIYVPRDALESFMEEARADFLEHGVNLFYGTIRLIEKDDESFLAWARQPYACVIFNLHTDHAPEGIRHSANAFRRLIDMAIRRGGSYYLTYHRYARRDQVETCYPQFESFLRLKRKYDPGELFESDWYRHYRPMFS